MKQKNVAHASIIALLLGTGLLAGCGGTKVLKEPQPIETTQPLAARSDKGVTATLDWVIVRDGPGTWARNADWDEYQLRVSNQSDQPIKITEVFVVDSLNTRIESQSRRKSLVKGSKKTARRYKKSGIKVKAGAGAGTMLVAGAAVTAVGVSTAYGVANAAILSGLRCGKRRHIVGQHHGGERRRSSRWLDAAGSGARRRGHRTWREQWCRQHPDRRAANPVAA
jgi:hypothetical protein